MRDEQEKPARLWVEVDGQYVWVEMFDGDRLMFRRSGRSPHGPTFENMTYRRRGDVVIREVKVDLIQGTESWSETVRHRCKLHNLCAISSYGEHEGQRREIQLPEWELLKHSKL